MQLEKVKKPEQSSFFLNGVNEWHLPLKIRGINGVVKPLFKSDNQTECIGKTNTLSRVVSLFIAC